MKIKNSRPLRIEKRVGQAKFKILNYRKGFTLIELMIVIAITGILVAVAVVNSGINPDRDVRLERDRLTTFLRDVQNMALSAERPSKTDAPACYSGNNYICNLCGFGIKRSGGNIQVYYVKKTDLNGTCSSIANQDSGNYVSKIFYPRNGVAISGLGASEKILFLIPNGDIYNNGSPLSGVKTITLSKTDGSTASVNVTISSGGIIK